jgi:hypothetical protein
MRINVETRATTGGDREPVSFSIGARTLRVTEVLDRWPATGYAYFKVEADDGGRYILRHAFADNEWDMHQFFAS